MAHRKAREEAGIELVEITHAFDFYSSPGITTEYTSIYHARTNSAPAGGIHDLEAEGEDIKAVVMSFSEVIAALENGRINCGPVIAAVQWLAPHRDQVRQC